MSFGFLDSVLRLIFDKCDPSEDKPARAGKFETSMLASGSDKMHAECQTVANSGGNQA
jgi:hypothetical protein